MKHFKDMYKTASKSAVAKPRNKNKAIKWLIVRSNTNNTRWYNHLLIRAQKPFSPVSLGLENINLNNEFTE